MKRQTKIYLNVYGGNYLFKYYFNYQTKKDN